MTITLRFCNLGRHKRALKYSMNILIVEDEFKIAQFLAQGLNESGYHSTIASDGLEALSLLNTDKKWQTRFLFFTVVL